MADFRALCAKLSVLLEELHSLVSVECPRILDEDSGGSWKLDLDTEDALDGARAALAQPEPEGPSDEELTQFLFENFRGPIEFLCDAEEEAHLMIRSHVKFARAVLARWGK
jgi:hypothetical protein